MTYQMWRNGAPTQAAIEHYTEGDCWILAFEAERIHGFPVFVIDDGARGSMHYVVKVGEDRYLDVTGVNSEAELEAEWAPYGATRLIEASAAERRWATDDRARNAESFEGSWRRAPLMIRRLMEAHNVRPAR